MTGPRLSLLSAMLLTMGACADPGKSPTGSAQPLPATVRCEDALELRDLAAAARAQITILPGDRAQIIGGNRAGFLASAAIIADLRCKAIAANVDTLLGEALAVGRAAEAATSEYEAAKRWAEADLIAADAIALLVRHLPASLQDSVPICDSDGSR